MCKGTSLAFAYRSVTAYCANNPVWRHSLQNDMVRHLFCILWCPKEVLYQHWGHYSVTILTFPCLCTADKSVHPTFTPLINQFIPPLHCWSITSHHLCITDQLVHPTFAWLINLFTPPLHRLSISSPHLCTADQSVHPTFTPLINQFTPLCTADQSVHTTLHRWSISSPHLCTADQSVHPTLHHWSISSHHLCITDKSVYTPWVLRPPQVSIMIPGDHKFVNNT